MSIYDYDSPPGKAILREFHGQSRQPNVTLTETLLAAIADELHQINQHIEDRNL